MIPKRTEVKPMKCWWCRSEMFWYDDIELETGLAAVLTCPNCGAVATVEQPVDLDE